MPPPSAEGREGLAVPPPSAEGREGLAVPPPSWAKGVGVWAAEWHASCEGEQRARMNGSTLHSNSAVDHTGCTTIRSSNA